MKITPRSLHRDLGYFYIGLIISFAASGIMMNHRSKWHPEKYTVEQKNIQVHPIVDSQVSDVFAKSILLSNHIDDKYKRYSIKNDELRIVCEKTDVDIELKTGKGTVTFYNSTPLISHIMKLHKNTSDWWIYYGDIFGLSLITIAITGTMMYANGRFSFKRRGWKLALAGVLFPLLFLILLA